MKRLLAILLALIMLLSLAACEKPGETKPSAQNPGTTGGKDPSNNSDPTNGSNSPLTPGSYVYAPPTDNFYIETETYIEARSDNFYTYWDKEDNYYSYHVNYELKGVWEYCDGSWHLSEYYEYDQYEDMRNDPPYIFSYMEDGLLAYLRMFCDTEEELNEELQEYYVEEETVAGVKCKVYDSQGFNTLRCKYWIAPSNGCVLKYDHYQEEGYSEEVLVYDLNYTQFGAELQPEEYEDPCTHWDEDLSGSCDYCERSFSKTQLTAPVIHIDEDGDLSWHVEGEWRNTVKYLLRINGEESETEKDGMGTQPKHGDRFQVKAIADPRGIWADSQWSEEFVFEYAQDYEFLNIGLKTSQEETLVAYFSNFAPGAYYMFGDLYAYKCENSDLIFWDEDKDHQVYTQNGYSYYKLHANADGESCHDHYRYGENKLEYYSALASALTLFSWCTTEGGEVYADGDAFLQAQGITLLGPGNVDGIGGGYELLNYREYSQSIDRNYIVTGYMHPATRYFDWFSNYSGKVLYWEVAYINVPWVFVEGTVRIQFTEAFDHTDFESLRSNLSTQGMSPLYGNSFGAVTENAYNSFDGQIPVYHMSYPDENENWYDNYKLVGFVDPESSYSIPYLFQADYLYSYWFDGGTNATYVRRLDGLWRVVPGDNGDDIWMLTIGPDGTVYSYDPETGLPI